VKFEETHRYGLFHHHIWRSATAPDGMHVKACECGRILPRCERYPYGRINPGVWCPYADCNCDECIDERKPMPLSALRFDD
jgi:hypothetical protein